MNIQITQLDSKKDAPWDLLLLADPSQKSVNKYLEKGICYIAKFEGETIGVLVILETKPKTFEIMNLAVKENFQNQGVGKELLVFAIETIKKKNAKVIEIGTGNSSAAQMLLYQKCGFRIFEIDFDFYRKNYPERIYENGIECRDMIRLRLEL